MSISASDLTDLKYAKQLLEHQGLIIKTINKIGTPIEKGLQFLPVEWKNEIRNASEKAVKEALNVAVSTISEEDEKTSNEFIHKMAVTVCGGIAGGVGIPGLFIELPISTIIMLRSIAEIARTEGENIHHLESRLACLEVFAYGAGYKDSKEKSGYFAARMALSKAVNEAAVYIAERGLLTESSPAIIRLITQIASRYGIVVTEKMVASALPIIGAVGGALINNMFITHFQDVARGHFIVRRLERAYGHHLVKDLYETII